MKYNKANLIPPCIAAWYLSNSTSVLMTTTKSYEGSPNRKFGSCGWYALSTGTYLGTFRRSMLPLSSGYTSPATAAFAQI